MILLWLSYFCLINGLTAQNDSKPVEGSGTPPIDVSSPYSKTIMCSYRGNMMDDNSAIPNLEPQNLPNECGAIIYDRFSIGTTNQFNVDYESLKLATSARPVIMTITRDNGYPDWAKVLTPEGNQAETQALCQFAKENDIKGFLLTQLAPQSPMDTMNINISQYIIPYLKQLKCSNEFIVGVSVIAVSAFIKCPHVYDFAQMNELVDFYRLFTIDLNECRPEIYNGVVVLEAREHGENYLVGMMEVTEFLNSSKINFDKIYYGVELLPYVNDIRFLYDSYVEVCKGSLNLTISCVQNTNDYFEKGKYVKSLNAGLDIIYVELDDVDNSCDCGQFIGFNNIIAGYNGKSATPCPKFDVQTACT